MRVKCSGPGPHDPVDGILGESDRPVSDMRCGSAACAPQPDPSGATIAALDDRLDQALTGLRDYVKNASPTNAQTVTAVKLLCRVGIALIRQRRGLLDGTD